jgi:hypothetical protein
VDPVLDSLLFFLIVPGIEPGPPESPHAVAGIDDKLLRGMLGCRKGGEREREREE